VQTYPTLNVADKVTAPVDTSKRGFSMKLVQAVAGQANTAARAEAQLAGTPADVSIPGPEAGGRYLIPGIVNFSNAGNNVP